MPDFLTIAALKLRCRDGAVAARLQVQIEDCLKKESANGKPFYEVRFRDGSDSLLLRAWSDTPAFAAADHSEKGDCVEVSGEFAINGPFGLDAKRWSFERLDDVATEALFAGTPEQRDQLAQDVAIIADAVKRITDPRLKQVSELFLEESGARFQRAAAARSYHHAFRGGLCRHVAQMILAADALAAVYPALNRDLLVTGTLFHDCGKLWESCPPEQGFDIPRTLTGELLGHISIGVEIVNALWRKLDLSGWRDLQPTNETVRLHLLHLIAAHHGQLEFGSPVEPKTPEAMALQYIDNLDAKMEMFKQAYAQSPEIGPGIFERHRPLTAPVVTPLPPLSSRDL